MAKKKKFKKGKFKSGTYVGRDIYFSRAFHSLRGFAPQLLILFLGKRDIDNNHRCLNANNITMTYIELENIYNAGQENKNLPKDGIARPRIIRAFNDLLAKGFITIIYHGGAYKKDRTIFGLSDQWKSWREGMVISTRPKEPKKGYQGQRLGATKQI